MALIDKDQTRAEIERRRNMWLAKSRLVKKGRDVAMYAAGKSSAYAEFLSYLDTLQEQPVEGLEKEIDKYFQPIQAWEVQEAPFSSLDKCARHFYELGQQSRPKVSDNSLEEEISRYLREECSGDDEPPVSEIARHFYDLGCRHTAVMYDDIEYERQRAEEAEITKGLEEAAKENYVRRFTGGKGINKEAMGPFEDFFCDDIEEYINGAKFGAKWVAERYKFDYTKGHHTAMVLSRECMNEHGWFQREREIIQLTEFIEKLCGYNQSTK